MFSKDGRFRGIHSEYMVENVKKCMLTLQRLFRGRPQWNSGTAHIFWYMVAEHMEF